MVNIIVIQSGMRWCGFMNGGLKKIILGENCGALAIVFLSALGGAGGIFHWPKCHPSCLKCKRVASWSSILTRPVTSTLSVEVHPSLNSVWRRETRLLSSFFKRTLKWRTRVTWMVCSERCARSLRVFFFFFSALTSSTRLGHVMFQMSTTSRLKAPGVSTAWIWRDDELVDCVRIESEKDKGGEMVVCFNANLKISSEFLEEFITVDYFFTVFAPLNGRNEVVFDVVPSTTKKVYIFSSPFSYSRVFQRL